MEIADIVLVTLTSLLVFGVLALLYHIIVNVPKNRAKYDEEYRQKVLEGTNYSGTLKRVVDKTILLPYVLLIIDSGFGYNHFFYVNASFEELVKYVDRVVRVNAPYHGRGGILNIKLSDESHDNSDTVVGIQQEITFREARIVSLFE